MTRTTTIGLFSLVFIALAGPALAQTVSPYAGEQSREIKALSAKEIEDLAQGRGMGLAKPAELNRYPGPIHVLELAREMRLSAEQRDGLEASRSRMSAKAKALGADILHLERELDTAFARRKIDSARLNDLTARIGARQGTLRAVHLEAHIETAALLSSEQISTYDALRGYGSTAPAASHGGHGTKH